MRKLLKSLKETFAEWRDGHDFKHGVVQILLAIDQLANVLSNPFSKQTWCDETISSRSGRLGHRYPYKFYKAVIDLIFHPFQGPDHCVNAYKKEMTRYQFPPEMRGTPATDEKKADPIVS